MAREASTAPYHLRVLLPWLKRQNSCLHHLLRPAVLAAAAPMMDRHRSCQPHSMQGLQGTRGTGLQGPPGTGTPGPAAAMVAAALKTTTAQAAPGARSSVRARSLAVPSASPPGKQRQPVADASSAVQRAAGRVPPAEPDSQPDPLPPAWLLIRPSAARPVRATLAGCSGGRGRSYGQAAGTPGRALPGAGRPWGRSGQGSRPAPDRCRPVRESSPHQVPLPPATEAAACSAQRRPGPVWSPGTPPKRRCIPPCAGRADLAQGPPPATFCFRFVGWFCPARQVMPASGGCPPPVPGPPVPRPPVAPLG